jgi:hypothetical protein
MQIFGEAKLIHAQKCGFLKNELTNAKNADF